LEKEGLDVIQDVIAELNRIRAAGLISNYAIGGAVAADVYIAPSSTEDIDVFVIFAQTDASPLAPLGPIWADLQKHGAIPEGGHLVIGGWPVQVLPAGSPLYDEAIQTATDKDFGGGVIGRVMKAEYLVAIAVSVGRQKDYMRVVEFVQRRVVDLNVLQQLLTKHNLQSQWAVFKGKFLATNA
jgi:hypothetical protein